MRDGSLSAGESLDRDAVEEMRQAFGGTTADEAVANAKRWALTTTVQNGVRPADERAIVTVLRKAKPGLGPRSVQYLAHHLA
jgi:hypothetical protein